MRNGPAQCEKTWEKAEEKKIINPFDNNRYLKEQLKFKVGLTKVVIGYKFELVAIRLTNQFCPTLLAESHTPNAFAQNHGKPTIF